jgi:hypothetical protein
MWMFQAVAGDAGYQGRSDGDPGTSGATEFLPNGEVAAE